MSYKNVFWLTRKNKMKHDEFCMNEMGTQKSMNYNSIYQLYFLYLETQKVLKKMDGWKLEEINRKGDCSLFARRER